MIYKNQYLITYQWTYSKTRIYKAISIESSRAQLSPINQNLNKMKTKTSLACQIKKIWSDRRCSLWILVLEEQDLWTRARVTLQLLTLMIQPTTMALKNLWLILSQIKQWWSIISDWVKESFMKWNSLRRERTGRKYFLKERYPLEVAS